MSKFELPISEDYESQIGYSEIYKRNVYQIVNKETRVIEFETPMFGTLKSVFDLLEQATDGGFFSEENEMLEDEDVINFPDPNRTTH